MNKILLLAICCFVVFLSCFNNSKPIVKADKTITTKTSFNTLFFDSVQLETFFLASPYLSKYKEQYFDFYKNRNFQFAWFDEKGLDEQANNFLNLLNDAVNNFQDSSIYIEDFKDINIVTKNKKIENYDLTELLKTELQMTGQFFKYAAKVYKGMDVNAEDLGWFIPRKKVNLSKLLDTIIKSKINNGESFIPFNSQYYKLQQELLKYYKLKKISNWDTIPFSNKPYKKGDSLAIFKRLKNQLFLLGDLSKVDSSEKFNQNLVVAVKSFQKRFGLIADGVISKKTIEIFNIPLSLRIEQLLVNLERARWLPAEKDSNYILVNIPEYKMHIFDSAVNKWDINVIVGKTATSTVIFTGKLKYIVFSPFWNLPYSIIKNEVMPGIKKNKNYLAQNEMEIYAKGDSFPLIRQKPGPKNSLGLVKFLFPNSYDIYFHDTPQRNLFSANERSFSHGCIRVGEPKKLAQYLLRKDTTYKSEVIDSLMHLTKEKWVNLPKPIPVFIIYFTTWVDKNGKLNFRKDIYKHDEKMANKLFDRQPIIDSIPKVLTIK